MQVLDRLSLADVSTGTRWLVDLMVVLALWMDASQPVFGAATAMVWCIVTPYGNPRLLAYRAFGLTIVRYVRDYVLIAVARSVALVLVRCPRPTRHRRMEFAALSRFFPCGICDSIYRVSAGRGLCRRCARARF